MFIKFIGFVYIILFLFHLLFQVLYILPRITSTHATARVKLAKHRVEPHHHLTFGLAKRKKVTIWIKVGLNHKLFKKKMMLIYSFLKHISM